LFVEEKEEKPTQNVNGIMDKGVAGVDEFQSNHNSHLEVFLENLISKKEKSFQHKSF
jgi:hypothetical protein